ncbi:ABC transporter ATP-binding protein [Desulfococcus sp.]|uniref:ABC transporter ATP-binding protein n=1 Tax=Desulfococcus sp. TaxID=2025834 RepID=UPI00359483B1
MTGEAPFIDVRGVRYAYRDAGPWVLNGIDLTVPPGGYLLVAGASGSGKSTLARTLNGLIPHFHGGRFEGEVRVGGVSTLERSVGDLFDQVGVVFQNPEAQLFNRTVLREIAFGLESLGLPRQDIRRRIDAIAQEMEIAHLLDRSPHRLSGGEQQMVSLSAIAALRPKMIVLDEPYANLDGENARRLRKTLSRLWGRGTGILVCEHRLAHTAADADRMIVMEGGRKVLEGPPEAVLREDMGACGLDPPEPGTPRWDAFPAGPEPGFETGLGADPPLVALENVSFERDGRRILDNVSFSIRRGECVAVVGPNGAGKTTLLKHFNGLLRPTSGRVLLEGRDIRGEKVSRTARHVGMAFQNPAGQFFKLTVWDEITVAARAMNCFDPEWIHELVRMFRLEPLAARPPYRLSCGEKKRVAFAAALSARPKVLVLDEPTSGQDWHFKNALGGFLTALRERGQTVVLVTHDLSFAAKYASRWLMLKDGRIVSAGVLRRSGGGTAGEGDRA